MWDKLEQAGNTQAGDLQILLDELQSGSDPHLLFDALLLKWKHEQNLPLLQPTTISDVPVELKSEYERVYIDAARQTGQKLLDTGRIADAWMYFRAINEPGPVAEAIEKFTPAAGLDDELEEVLQLALYQRVNPAKGVQLMLSTHGMCNTVTALDQLYLEIQPKERTACAKIMVDQLYQDLLNHVRYDVEQRSPLLPPDLPLRELIAGRLWLFENDNYHIDVSHLNAVVRFARALEEDDHEYLDKAIQLAEYGACLSPQLQYPSEPPFDTYYESHQAYFQIVGNIQREESLQYFQERLEAAEDEQDRQLMAYVLVDLFMRVQDCEAAIQTAEKHLGTAHEQSGFSFVNLCQDTGNMEALQRHARKINNPVLYVAARLHGEK